jgi:hypothetical protein
MEAHSLTAQAVLAHFGVDARAGLSEAQVQSQLGIHGRNGALCSSQLFARRKTSF